MQFTRISIFVYVFFIAFTSVVTAFRDIGGRIRVCVAISVRARVSIKATLISSGLCILCPHNRPL